MSDEFHAILKQYDIIFFAETDMLLGEDAADVPRSFKIISLPRNPRLQTGRRGSGIAVLIREDIEFVKTNLN
jgi:hypothetical protein